MEEPTLTGDTPLITWLRKVQHERGLFPSQLAKQLGVSHATVSRWMSGKDIPKATSCVTLSNLTGEPVARILALAGHIPASAKPAADLPPFREYMARKYPDVHLDYVDAIARGIDGM